MRRFAVVIGTIGLSVVLPACGAGQEVNQQKQQEAIAKIKELEGKFELDEKGKGTPVIKVVLANTRAKNADLEVLKPLKFIRDLSLAGTRITNSGLAHIKGLSDLQTLDLRGTGVNDNGVEYLRSLVKLQVLNLEDTEITDKGLDHLKKLSVLGTLILRRTKVTDAGIEKLKQLLPEVNVIR